MIDGIIAGTGNSRSLYGSLPSTYAEFKAAVEAGTQYVDVSYNAAGWQQEPTFLNKANLLTDAVAALFGLTPNDTVNDAFSAASGLITMAQTTANGRVLYAGGTYVGTGSGAAAFIVPFEPSLVLIEGMKGVVFPKLGLTITNARYDVRSVGTPTYNTTTHLLSLGLSGIPSASSENYMNTSGTTYRFVAFS